MAHPATETDYPDERFTPDELVILQEDPRLTVVVTKEEPTRPNAKDSIDLVKAAMLIKELDELAVGEERKSVLSAIAARRAELTPDA
ncbi:MAG: hypothetical protein KKF37_02660 [Proteobacteria bacterium]|nr:hypothetical protein [Pseudomonadota bacterium]